MYTHKKEKHKYTYIQARKKEHTKREKEYFGLFPLRRLATRNLSLTSVFPSTPTLHLHSVGRASKDNSDEEEDQMGRRYGKQKGKEGDC